MVASVVLADFPLLLLPPPLDFWLISEVVFRPPVALVALRAYDSPEVVDLHARGGELGHVER